MPEIVVVRIAIAKPKALVSGAQFLIQWHENYGDTGKMIKGHLKHHIEITRF
jgi:hypothetical protein